MATSLVLTYVAGALLTMVALGAYRAHRGRWGHTFDDHLMTVITGLAWPVALPLALLVFLVALVAHVSTVIKNRAGQ